MTRLPPPPLCPASSSARDSLELLGTIYHLDNTSCRKRIAHLAEIFEIGNLPDQPVRKLSLGQRIRCEIAGSLIHSPSIVFLDEPSIGLDIIAKQKLRGFIRRINREEGVTVFLTRSLSDLGLRELVASFACCSPMRPGLVAGLSLLNAGNCVRRWRNTHLAHAKLEFLPPCIRHRRRDSQSSASRIFRQALNPTDSYRIIGIFGFFTRAMPSCPWVRTNSPIAAISVSCSSDITRAPRLPYTL